MRGEIKAETLAAAAGQEIRVPVKPDTSQWAQMVRGFTSGGAMGPAMKLPVEVDPKVDEGKAGAEGRKAGDTAGRSFKDIFTQRTADINFGSGRFRIPVEGIIPAVQALGDLTGILGIIPGLAIGAAASFGVMATGVASMVSVLKDWTQAQDASQGRTASMAAAQIAASNSLISASHAVRDARRAVADAEDNYARSVTAARRAITDAVRAEHDAEVSADQAISSATQSLASAQQTLTRAQHDALQAQKDLTAAYEAANRALEDAPNKVKDASLANTQAVIDLRDAQDRLFAGSLTVVGAMQELADAQDAVNSPTQDHAKALDRLVTAQKNYQAALANQNNAPADMQALSLAVQRASQNVDETALSYQRAQEDADKLTSAGVNGASQVVSAQDRVAQSQQAVRDATRGVGTANEALIRAQVDGDQRVIDAHQKVIDATDGLAQAERAGSESVVKAKEQVEDALRSQQAAIASVAAQAESAAGSLAKYNAELALLSPAGQAVIVTILGLRDRWKDLRNEVQQRMFVGVSADIQHLADADLPVLRFGLGLIADSFNTIIHRTIEWATSRESIRDFRQIFADTAVEAGNLGDASISILDIIRNIAAVAGPILKELTGDWADAAQHAADFISHARDTGQLGEWIQKGIDVAQQLWQIFSNLVGIIKDVVMAPNSFGGGFLGFFIQVTGTVKWLLDNFPILVPILESVFLISRIAAFAQWIGIVRVATMAWAAAQWILDAAMDANPIGLVVLAVAALAAGAYLIYRNWGSIVSFFESLWRGIVDWTKWGVNGAILLMNGLIDGFNIAIRGLNIINPFKDIPSIPHIPHWLASGGVGSGLTMVGEHGPELLNLPAGTQVSSAPDTRMRLANQTSGEQRITLEFRNGDGSDFTDMVIDLVRNGLRTKGIKVAGLTA